MAEAGKLNGAKIPISFQLGDRLIDGAVVKPIMFASFVNCIRMAQLMPETKPFEARLKRLRMHRQVTYYSNDVIVPIGADDVLKLPIPAARDLLARLDQDEGTAGKIIRSGNGIDHAIIYELGTPISLQGKDPIRELEFHAETYGDIEDVLSVDIELQQAAMLIATIAKPLGFPLLRLPTWALEMITIADGITISREVLPHFTESPAE